MTEDNQFYHLLTQEMKESRLTRFMRLELKNTIYYCKQYQQTKTKNSYTIRFDNPPLGTSYGVVECYVAVNEVMYAVVTVETEAFHLDDQFKESVQNETLRTFVDNHLCRHIRQIVSQEQTIIVPSWKIISKCVYMENFVSVPTNLVEHG